MAITTTTTVEAVNLQTYHEYQHVVLVISDIAYFTSEWHILNGTFFKLNISTTNRNRDSIVLFCMYIQPGSLDPLMLSYIGYRKCHSMEYGAVPLVPAGRAVGLLIIL